MPRHYISITLDITKGSHRSEKCPLGIKRQLILRD